MTLSAADRSTKAQKVKVVPIAGTDPEAHRSEMLKVLLATMQALAIIFMT